VQKYQLFNLATEFNETTKIKRLYKATVNGFAAQTFHAFCDGYANTLIVIKSANGNVFGAYTSAAGLWSSTTGYSEDSNAFIYSLVNSYNTPLIMKAITPTNSVRNIANKGPSFGLSAVDLSISDYSNLNNLSTAALSNTFKHPSLTGTPSASFLAGSANFSVLDIEVYHVIPSISKILSEMNCYIELRKAAFLQLHFTKNVMIYLIH
jgi:hypothetical protein